jgi:hypothetical protein
MIMIITRTTNPKLIIILNTRQNLSRLDNNSFTHHSSNIQMSPTTMSNITMRRLTIPSNKTNQSIKTRLKTKEAMELILMENNRAILISKIRDKLLKSLRLSSLTIKTKRNQINIHHIERFLSNRKMSIETKIQNNSSNTKNKKLEFSLSRGNSNKSTRLATNKVTVILLKEIILIKDTHRNKTQVVKSITHAVNSSILMRATSPNDHLIKIKERVITRGSNNVLLISKIQKSKNLRSKHSIKRKRNDHRSSSREIKLSKKNNRDMMKNLKDRLMSLIETIDFQNNSLMMFMMTSSVMILNKIRKNMRSQPKFRHLLTTQLQIQQVKKQKIKHLRNIKTTMKLHL